ITPSTDLHWTPCYDNFTCARLTVPLDYTDPSIGTVAVAYIRKASTSKPIDSAESIMFNPGGPGDSGIDAILSDYGNMIASYIGPDYNIIGFDPRGVNNTGPDFDCFRGSPPSVAAEFARRFQRPIDSKSKDSIADIFELSGGFGDWCSHVHANDSVKYANTPAVARDMLNFAEKNAEAQGKKAAEAKVWYWGISYGSVLGATFSALFPDRVGRVVLDGVMDAEDYYRGTWKTALVDSDKAVQAFGQACHNAGPGRCAFYFNTPDTILANMRIVLESMRKQPVVVTDPVVTDSPRLATYEDLTFMVASALYTPYQYFPVLAQIFSDLSGFQAPRNGSSLFQALASDPQTAYGTFATIGCLDAAGRYNLSSIAKWEAHIAEVQKTTEWVSETFVSAPLLCRQMSIVPPKSQQFHGEEAVASRTSFPILFIGNTIDLVTPHRSAQKMSDQFPSSVLLTQKSVGHTSLSSWSRCTAKYVRAYFRGTLPPMNTTCEVETIPFFTDGAF
ncbi:TAP-like protein-domain-containing protein, partial [Clohesyomyces aquaticus]